jgi:hypothetical protein
VALFPAAVIQALPDTSLNRTTLDQIAKLKSMNVLTVAQDSTLTLRDSTLRARVVSLTIDRLKSLQNVDPQMVESYRRLKVLTPEQEAGLWPK